MTTAMKTDNKATNRLRYFMGSIIVGSILGTTLISTASFRTQHATACNFASPSPSACAPNIDGSMSSCDFNAIVCPILADGSFPISSDTWITINGSALDVPFAAQTCATHYDGNGATCGGFWQNGLGQTPDRSGWSNSSDFPFLYLAPGSTIRGWTMLD